MARRGKTPSRMEWTLMHLCWRLGEVPARAVHEEAVKVRRWEYQTTKTQLDRLVAKGFLHRRKLGPIWLYRPAVSRARAIAQAIDGFVDTVLDHTLAPLFLHFANAEKLRPDDLEALEKLVRRSRKG